MLLKFKLTKNQQKNSVKYLKLQKNNIRKYKLTEKPTKYTVKHLKIITKKEKLKCQFKT